MVCFFWGGVGVGNTYMAACIANALIDQEKRVLMTDFVSISNICPFVLCVGKKKLVKRREFEQFIVTSIEI